MKATKTDKMLAEITAFVEKRGADGASSVLEAMVFGLENALEEMEMNEMVNDVSAEEYERCDRFNRTKDALESAQEDIRDDAQEEFEIRVDQALAERRL